MIKTSPLTRFLRSGASIALIAAFNCVPAQAQMSLGNLGTFGPTAGPSGGGNSGASVGTSSGMVTGVPGNTSGPTDMSQSGTPSGGQGIGGNQLENAPNTLQGNASSRSNQQAGRTNRSPSDPLANDDSRPGSSRSSSPDSRSPRSLQQPSQFQQFVQQATGRLLPMYGAELFERPEVYVADANGPVSDDYILGPGDDVKVQVWGGVNYDGTLTIDRNGQVIFQGPEL